VSLTRSTSPVCQSVVNSSTSDGQSSAYWRTHRVFCDDEDHRGSSESRMCLELRCAARSRSAFSRSIRE
jgi:hypothetical protein